MNPYADHYQQQQVLTANPSELLLLTYDGAIRHLRTAADAMAQRDLNLQNEAIGKAQQIVMYLMTTLDHKHSPKLASSLEQIYSYVLDRLVDANVKDDEDALQHATKLLKELRSGWAEASAGETPIAVGVQG